MDIFYPPRYGKESQRIFKESRQPTHKERIKEESILWEINFEKKDTPR